MRPDATFVRPSDRTGGSSAPAAAWVRLQRATLIPLLSWLVSNLVAWATAALSGQDYLLPRTHQRWDSQWYLSIAEHGYESYRCIERYSWFPDVWCGNTAWFPGYPMAIRLVSALGMTPAVAGVVVSEAALLGALLVCWQLLGGRPDRNAVPAMALAAVFPGSIYFHTVFPVSLCLLGLSLVVLGIRRESWLLAGVGAFVAFATHFVGVIGVIGVALSLAFGWRGRTRPGRLWRVAAATGLGSLAYPWMLWLMHADTGSWTIYWQHQGDYGNTGWHNPLEQLGRFWSLSFSQWHPASANDPWLVARAAEAQHPQLAINLAFAVLLIGTALWRLYRRDLPGWQLAATVIALGAFAVPLVSGAWSAWYRHDALMLVALPVLRMPRLVWALLIAVCTIQAVLLGAMWFGGSLI